MSGPTQHLDGALTVWVHEDAIDEAAGCDWSVEAAAESVVAAFRRGLQRTAGTKLRALSRQDSNREYRFRRGGVRVICTQTHDADGVPVLALHAIRPRGVVYREDRFEARLDAFYERAWDVEAARARPEIDSTYVSIRVDAAAGGELEADEGSCVPLLTDTQFACLDDLLPFPAEFGAEHAFLLLGHGPPGCGKTLVAQEAAVAAHLLCEYDVLVLAPTDEILARVAAYAGDQGVRTSREFAVAEPDGAEPSFRLLEVREFIRRAAGDASHAVTREAALFDWWRRMQRVPGLSAWMNARPDVKSPAFARLMDALWTEPEVLWSRAKDGLAAQYGSLLERLVELRTSDRIAGVLNDARVGSELRFRCEIGQQASRRLPELDPACAGPSSRRLLVLVDECQDLAPAEWRALVGWCAARLAQGAPTRVALLGDENQRITPTAFSWDSVQDHARNVLKLPGARIVERLIERRSFRLPRQVARLARVVFDRRLLEVAGTRQAAYAADEGENARQGRVDIHVVPDATATALAAAMAVASRLEGEARLTLIVPEDANGASTVERLDLIRPRRVKGMEYERAVVVSPLASTVARRARRLAYDEATVAYTVLTRTSRDMLCVMTPAEWDLLTPVADSVAEAGATVALHGGDGSSHHVGTTLAGVLASFSEVVSRETRIERLVRQLAAAVEELSGVDPGEPFSTDRLFVELVESATELVRLEEPMRVVGAGAAMLMRHPWLATPLREGLDRAHSAGDDVRCVALALLLGETAAANDVLLSRERNDDRWRERTRAAIADGMDGWQRLLRGERAARALAPATPGARLVRALLLHRAGAALSFLEDGE